MRYQKTLRFCSRLQSCWSQREQLTYASLQPDEMLESVCGTSSLMKTSNKLMIERRRLTAAKADERIISCCVEPLSLPLLTPTNEISPRRETSTTATAATASAGLAGCE